MKHTNMSYRTFIKSLKPKIKNKFANKFAECRFQPRTLEQAFSLALDLEKKIQIVLILSEMTSWIAGPPQQLMRSSPFPLEGSHSVNEISNYRNSNSNNHGKNNCGSMPWQQKNDNKSWQNRDNKQWQNRDNKPWQNKDKKSWQNNKSKDDKPLDTCFTLSQDKKKFFVPADCDKKHVPDHLHLGQKHRLTKQNNQVAMGKRLMR